MSWRFNPPPGWQAQPEGWRPPPDWAPDPGWPPAPAGWQFWLPAGPAGHHRVTQPATSPPAGSPPVGSPTPWHQQWWAAGGVTVAVLLVGCLVGSALALVTDPGQVTGSPVGTPTSSPPASTGPTGPPAASATPDPGTPAGLGPGEERTGQGPSTVQLDLPADRFHTVTLTYTGDGPFQAMLVDDRGDFVGTLGTNPEDNTGTYPLELGVIDPPSAVDIVEAEGSWTLLVQDIADAPVWPEQTEGTGAAVLRIDPAAIDGPTPVTGTHDGESNFVAWSYSETGDEFGGQLVFNEIGAFSGASQLSPDTELYGEPIVIAVQADGAWRITPP